MVVWTLCLYDLDGENLLAIFESLLAVQQYVARVFPEAKVPDGHPRAHHKTVWRLPDETLLYADEHKVTQERQESPPGVSPQHQVFQADCEVGGVYYCDTHSLSAFDASVPVNDRIARSLTGDERRRALCERCLEIDAA